jgi:limonene 1,2-monooxygenase
VARYVIPEINRMTVGFRASQRHLIENRDSFERAGQAVMAKIMSHEGATRALKEGAAAQAMPGHNAPDLRSERQKAATGSAAEDVAGG